MKSVLKFRFLNIRGPHRGSIDILKRDAKVRSLKMSVPSTRVNTPNARSNNSSDMYYLVFPQTCA